MGKTAAICLSLMVLLSISAVSQIVSPVDEARRLTNFGVEAALRGLWSEANFRWEQALEISPGFPAALNNLAVVYEHFGKYELADKRYRAALKISNENRFISSNNRMFQQFMYQHVQNTKSKKKNKPTEGSKPENTTGETDGGESRNAKQANGDESTLNDLMNIVSDSESDVPDALYENVYHKVGSANQVLIKHPKRQTPMSEKYRRVYIAGFVPLEKGQENLNFETTEFLRSELRKYSIYDVIPLEELNLPEDEDELDQLIDDREFWQRLGNKVGADLIVYGTVNFYSEPSDGFYPYEYRDANGTYRTARMRIMRTSFTIELDLFFHEAATGELIHQEGFGQTIVYRGRLDPTLQVFYDVMNRVLPRFMDLMVPREHDAIRFLLYG